MFRTIVVGSGEKINIRDNWLVVTVQTEEQRVPVEDIYAIILENAQTSITVATLARLAEAGVQVVVCDAKHIPTATLYGLQTHYRPLTVVKKQLLLPQELKDFLWQRIIQGKINNQAQALAFCGIATVRVERLQQLAAEVLPGDSGNREGIAAKWFFRSLYGAGFLRMEDDAINAALNYGYAIIRAAFAQTLAAHGFHCAVGLHHISESNAFNLADDMMEPLRPLVDMWVDRNQEELVEGLHKRQRRDLVNLLNQPMLWDNKKMQVRTAIEKYITSLTSAIERRNAEGLKIPLLINCFRHPEAIGDE